MSEREVIHYEIGGGRWSNTFEYGWLWSLKRGKWVRGRCGRAVGGCDYYIYPASYVRVRASGFLDDRGVDVVIEEIRVSPDEYPRPIRELVRAHIPFSVFREITDDPEAPESLRAFVEAIPPYHGGPATPPDTVYPEGELDRMVEYLKNVYAKIAED